jgi:hypothetical protein
MDKGNSIRNQIAKCNANTHAQLRELHPQQVDVYKQDKRKKPTTSLEP